MTWIIFIFWVLATPFIVWNGYYEGPKVFSFLSLGFTLSTYWVLQLIRDRNSLNIEKKDVWFIFWLLVLTVSSLLGVHPLDSVLGGSYRHQGVIFFLSLWLVEKTVLLMDDKRKRLLNKGVAIVIFAETIIVFFQLVSGKLYFGKPLGTLGEANAVAGMLAIGLYWVIVMFPKAFFFPVLAVFLSQSRSGTLTVLSNIGYLMNSVSTRVRNFIIVLVLMFVGFSLFFFSMVKSNLPFDTFESRQIIWPLSIQQIVTRPILGYGAESGEVVFEKAFKSHEILLSGLVVDRAHNLFLDVTIWSGLVGLVAFSGWLYFKYKDLKDVGKKMAFLSFLIYAFFQPLSVVHWLLFILIL